MKITEKDTKLLIMLLGIAILVICYSTIYVPYINKTEELEKEIAELQPKAAELRIHNSKLAEYKAGIATAQEFIYGEIGRYPKDVRAEDLVLYAREMELALGFEMSNLSFTGAVPIGEITGLRSADGMDTFIPMNAYMNSLTFDGTLSYEQLKGLMTYIYSSDSMCVLNAVSASYDSETGSLTASAIVDKLFITAEGDEYERTPVPSVSVGTDKIFGAPITSDSIEE